VTAYGSVYTLVLMALDRYLAIVHPIGSIGWRTVRKTAVLMAITWVTNNAYYTFIILPLLYDRLFYLWSGRASLIHVRGVRSNRAANFRETAILDAKNSVGLIH